MKQLLFILLISSIALTGCKKTAKTTAPATTAPVSSTPPLVSSATQDQYATSAVASAGWTNSQVTPTTPSNAQSARSAGYGGTVDSALSNTAKANQSMPMNKRAALLALVKSRANSIPFLAVVPYSKTVTAKLVKCAKGGSVTVSGSESGKDDTNLTTTPRTVIGDYQSSVNYTLNGCKGSMGYTVWGQGLEKVSYTYNISLIPVVGTTDGTYAMKMGFLVKATEGLAVLTPKAEKLKLKSDLDMFMSVDLKGVTSAVTNKTTDTGTVSLNIVAKVDTITCSLIKTYTWAEMLVTTFDAGKDIVCK